MNLELEMIAIPGGTFIMGSPEGEEESRSEEKPQHQVTIKPFLMGEYPITQAQWRAVAELPQVNQKLQPNPSRFKRANRPVEQVSWHDAIEFCARLSNHTKKPYRLPSEAQWEYACRAGTTTPFHFGETITTDLANYCGDYAYGRGQKGAYREETTEVGNFPPNAFGLHDMHGNVWEWCQDDWHNNYIDAPIDGTAWTGLDMGLSNDIKVLRGGSWDYCSGNCRSASRYYFVADFDNINIGFRVVCDVA
ncbi:MAG: formylglycine-generating enzyme family protein [Dolichospermum sp.]